MSASAITAHKEPKLDSRVVLICVRPLPTISELDRMHVAGFWSFKHEDICRIGFDDPPISFERRYRYLPLGSLRGTYVGHHHTYGSKQCWLPPDDKFRADRAEIDALKARLAKLEADLAQLKAKPAEPVKK